MSPSTSRPPLHNAQLPGGQRSCPLSLLTPPTDPLRPPGVPAARPPLSARHGRLRASAALPAAAGPPAGRPPGQQLVRRRRRSPAMRPARGRTAQASEQPLPGKGDIIDQVSTNFLSSEPPKASPGMPSKPGGLNAALNQDDFL